MLASEVIKELQGLVASHGDTLEIHFGGLRMICHCTGCELFNTGRVGCGLTGCVDCNPREPSNTRGYKIPVVALPQPQEQVKAHCAICADAMPCTDHPDLSVPEKYRW